MDFEKIAKSVSQKTGSKLEYTGEEGAPEYKITFSIEDGRTQEVTIFPFEEEGQEILKVITLISKKSDFSQSNLISFLELNMSLKFGAFAIFEGNIVIEASYEYEDEKDEERIIKRMKYIAKMADKFEKMLIGQDRN